MSGGSGYSGSSRPSYVTPNDVGYVPFGAEAYAGFLNEVM